jgi:pimeloyl-ACP methyl ester carboxylesterase
MMAGSPFEAEYKRLSPNPDGFPTLVEKLKALDLDRFAWDEQAFAAIDVPTLLVFGDADVVEIDHITKLFTLLGGHSNGDMQGLPLVQLAVLPGTSHINVIFNPANIEYLKAMVPTFLAQELPAPPQMTF